MDEARLARLVGELSAKPSYATGERRFPGAVAPDDAAAIAEALDGELDLGVAERARAADEQGFRVACGAGCASCCEVVVMVYRPEALAAARWLARPENAAARAHFLEVGYPRWRAAVGDAPEQLHALSGGDPASWERELMEAWRRRVPCAFLQGGLCTIYPARPLGCRNTHALETSERCVPDAERPADALAFVPVDAFMKRAVLLLRATHNALPSAERHRSEALCEAVRGLLTDRAAGASDAP